MGTNVSQNSIVSSPNNLGTNLMDENVGDDTDVDAGQIVPDAEMEQTSPQKTEVEDVISTSKKDSLNKEQKSNVELTPKQEENMASENLLTEEELTSSPPQKDLRRVSPKKDAERDEKKKRLYLKDAIGREFKFPFNVIHGL